ncbi:exodeoxyribonuclease VII small subunit [Denitratisoma sp. DHT3]|uniref:exodeoxyribonuclease VII small subunit n=1 Tax=Denitratisoma sp. DHT3 TaxID=1981880 RepID=UPI001198B102|nr:exodeoxyribonuclease VII small subunit [Denitratisoma sp. DHT3]
MAAPSSASAPSPASFEAALSELEGLVQSMEHGDMALEASLAAYQRGMDLLKYCQNQLAAAEQRIQILDNGELASFSAPTEDR